MLLIVPGYNLKINIINLENTTMIRQIEHTSVNSNKRPKALPKGTIFSLIILCVSFYLTSFIGKPVSTEQEGFTANKYRSEVFAKPAIVIGENLKNFSGLNINISK